MMRIRNFLPLTATLAVIAMAALAPPARAIFEISVYDQGQLVSTTAGLGLLANVLVPYTAVTTDFVISSGSGTSNFPGASTSMMSLSGNESILATSAYLTSGGTRTITIVESENGWLAPTGGVLLLGSAGGGSFILQAGNSVTATYQAFLDASAGNTIYPANTAYATPGGNSDALQSASGVGPFQVPPGQFDYTPFPDTTVVAGGTPFTLTTVQTFTFTLAAGSSSANGVNASDTSSVTAVPAPAGLVLALTGLPCLGIGQWLRRRRQAA